MSKTFPLKNTPLSHLGIQGTFTNIICCKFNFNVDIVKVIDKNVNIYCKVFKRFQLLGNPIIPRILLIEIDFIFKEVLL